ncbi:MAG: hypothetical protein U0X20_20135 [Caldilineaceae bacterium]
MWDSSSTGGENPLRRTVLRFVPWVIIVALGVALVGCLYYHPTLTAGGLVLAPHDASADVTATPGAGATVSAPVAAGTTAVVTSSLAAPEQSNPGTAAAIQPLLALTGTENADLQLDAMMTQLQVMQGNLQLAAQELDSRYGSAQPTVQATDLASLLAEMQRLNQNMQPLMAQIDTAVQSGRPSSEIEGMRTQMSSIHHRLTELMTAIEAARAAGTTVP